MVSRAFPQSCVPGFFSSAAALMLLGGLSGGCRSLPAPPLRTEPPPPPSALEALPPGSALAVPRPTSGVALLSLWIDAGARAASPPQLATVAAHWAAEQAGARARVLPDGSEISLLCDLRGEGLAACVRRLLRALRPPAPSEAELVRLREQLRGARLRAAQDVARQADRMALEALLGEAAQKLDPLGNPADDAQVDAARTGQFLAAHYVKSRSLLVGAGEVDKRQLDELSAPDTSSPGAAAATGRAPALVPAAATAPRIELGDANQIALVLPLSDVPRAAGVCERFLQIHPLGSARVSQLHGLVLAHFSLPGGAAPFARLQAAVFDLKRIVLEPFDGAPLPPPDELEALGRQVGETWIARGPSAAALGAEPGVALVLQRDQHAPDQNEEAALASLRERAARALADAHANSLGAVRGESSELAAHVTTENGAHVEVVRRPKDAWFAAALRFAGGSGDDPPTAHGRAALLASLLADGCGFSSGRTLDVWLATLQARLSPLLDADGLGVLISAPARHAEAALDTLLRCAVRPSFGARAVEDARARLLRGLWKREDTFFQATLAQSVAPSAPGMVAPWGTPEGVARIDAAELRRLHETRSRGPLISVWVAADREPLATARFVARRLAQLPAEVVPQARAALAPRGEIAGAFTQDARVRVVIGVRSERGERASSAPLLFARALGEALATRLGQPLWAWGGSASGLTAAGVALALREDELDALPAHTQAALHELAQRPEASFRGALQAALLNRSAALSSARGWAEAAFHGHATQHEDGAEIDASIRKLATERPSFFVLRPRP